MGKKGKIRGQRRKKERGLLFLSCPCRVPTQTPLPALMSNCYLQRIQLYIKKVASSLICLLVAMPPAFSPSAPFQKSLGSTYHRCTGTRLCLIAPKHGVSDHQVFCHWQYVAGNKQGSDASLQDPFPENIKKM